MPGYDELRVELPAPAATDAEVDEALQAQLRRHGELVDADRPAARGDFVTLDLEATRDGEEVAGLNTEDWSYEIGQGWVTDDFDDQLVGASAGDELTFTATPKGTEEPADFVVPVGKVQQLVAARGDRRVGRREPRRGERRRVAGDRRERIGGVQAQPGPPGARRPGDRGAHRADRHRAARAARAERPPAARRGHGAPAAVAGHQHGAVVLGHRPGRQHFVESLRGASTQAVKVDLALRAVAAAEALDADEGDLAAEYERMAVMAEQKPNQVRKAYERNDLVPELVAQIRKSKALDWLLHHVELVDPTAMPSTATSSSATPTTTTPTTTTRRRRAETIDRPLRAGARPVNFPELPRPQRRRADQPRRAGVRPLQPAAEGEHHLPADADRRPDRQPDLRPADPPRVGEPRQGHQHLHQQPRWRHHLAVRHLRHDAVHPQRDRHDLPRPGGVGGGGAAGRGHQGQAPGPARTRGSCCTSRTAPSATGRSPTWRSPPGRSCACATSSTSCWPSTRASRSSGSTPTPTATS